jgi:hypothetical protein
MVNDPDTIKAAYEVGINFFFLTGDMHWPLYEEARAGLKKLFDSGVSRDSVVIACACYPTQPEFCTAPFHEVIEFAPWIKRIDVCVMGGTYSNDFFARLPVYLRHKDTRMCGTSAVGATFHDRPSAVPAINCKLLDIAFIRYNPAHSGADRDVFPRLHAERKVPLFGFKSTYGSVTPDEYAALGVGEDNWRPRASDFYRYALSSPLDGVLCSPATPAQVGELVQAMERGPLSEVELEYMRNLGDLTEGRAVVDPG